MADSATELQRVYDALARYRWLVRTLRLARPGEGLEIHAALRAPAAGVDGPGAGTVLIHDWLAQKALLGRGGATLDVGAGLGASVLRWARTRRGTYVGLVSGAFEADKARAQACRLGLSDRCEFRRQSYDDPIEGRFASILALEALFHSPDLARSLANLARAAEAGARLVLCEHMVQAAPDTPPAVAGALQRLRERWATPRLWSRADFRSGLAAAGFRVEQELDLGAQVCTGAEASLAARERRLTWLERWLPSRVARGVVSAYLGGIALERLYRSGHASYVTMVAVR